MAFANRGRDKDSNSNHGAPRDRSRSRSREKETDQERENRERDQNQTIMMTRIAEPDLSMAFDTSDDKEMTLVSGQTVQHGIMPERQTTRICSALLTHHFGDAATQIRKSLLGMEAGEYVQFQPACVDGMTFRVRYFPHSHDAHPQGSDLFQTPRSSIGLSLSNKLDMIHRLRRGGKQAELKMTVTIARKKQHPATLTFNLSKLVTRNIVFKNLCTDDAAAENIKKVRDSIKQARCLQIKLEMEHDNAWQLNTTGDDEYRLKVYRNGLEYGDMKIYLIQGDAFMIFRADDAPDANSTNSNSSKSLNSSEKTEAEAEKKEEGRPTVLWDYHTQVSMVNLMSRLPYFETWIKKWSAPSAIAVSAPSILYLNWIAFYVATGQLHDSTDAEWFVGMANMMGDYDLLQCAIELCIQRLTKKNALRTCELFQGLGLAQGIAHLKKWITDNQGTLKRTTVERRHGKQTDVLEACKKALVWW